MYSTAVSASSGSPPPSPFARLRTASTLSGSIAAAAAAAAASSSACIRVAIRICQNAETTSQTMYAGSAQKKKTAASYLEWVAALSERIARTNCDPNLRGGASYRQSPLSSTPSIAWQSAGSAASYK